MDRMLRAEIIATVRQTMTEVLEGADEVWLKPKQLLEQFGMLSQEWLDRNGELLPREYASVVLPDGEEKCTRWAYPMHKINRMIQEGKLKGLVKMKKTTAADATGTVAAMQ
jgi:hypothetical protein